MLSSPAITQDGSIVVGSDDYFIYSLTSAGSLRWRYKTGFYVRSSPAIAQDGSIIIGSSDNYVYSLSSSTGSVLWMYLTESVVISSPAISGQDGSIFVGGQDMYLYCLSALGSLRWRYKASKQVYSSPALTQDGGSVVVGSEDAYIYCLSTSTGSLRWKYKTGISVTSSPAISAQTQTVVIGSADGHVYCLSTSTGSLRWRYMTGSSVEASPAIARDGSIIVGSYDYFLYRLSSAGSLLWRFQTGNFVYSSAAISQDGSIVFGNDDTNIYVIGGQPTARPTLQPTSSPSPLPTLPPTLFPTAAPFSPPPALELFGDRDVLGASAVVAVLLSLALFMLRDGADKGFSLTRHLPWCRKDERDDDDDEAELLTRFTPLEALLPVSLSLTATASNILQISKYLSSGEASQVNLAAVMIFVRLCTALHSIVLLLLSLTRESWSKLLVPAHLQSKASLWALLGLVMLTETSHIRFFAWRRNNFVERSRGFPNLFLFKTCLLSSAISSFVQFSLSIARGVTFSSSVSFGTSLLSFLLAVSTAAIKLVAEKIHAHDETLLAEQNDLRAVIAVLEAKLANVEARNAKLELQQQHVAIEVPSNRRVSANVTLAGVYGGEGEGSSSSSSSGGGNSSSRHADYIPGSDTDSPFNRNPSLQSSLGIRTITKK